MQLHTIPEFPKKINLTIEHRSLFTKHTAQFLPYSDFNFTSIWANNLYEDVEISHLHNNLIIRLRDYETEEPFYTLLGNTNIIYTIQELFAYFHSNKLPSLLRLVPESVVQSSPEIFLYFNVSEDKDNFDYIVAINDLLDLKGNKFENKRYHINHFKKIYPSHSTILLQSNAEHRTKINELFEHWRQQKYKSLEETRHELKSIERVLDNNHHFNPDVIMIGIEEANKLIGFSIGEIVTTEYAIGHFMKGNKQYNGVYELLYQSLAKELAKKGVKYLNIEQDLGDEKLRAAKKSWNPVMHLKKYIITPNRG